jgi:hypothetical protein
MCPIFKPAMGRPGASECPIAAIGTIRRISDNSLGHIGATHSANELIPLRTERGIRSTQGQGAVMASRVPFMSVCWQRGETAPWDGAGASGDTGRGGERLHGRETGGRETRGRETGGRETRGRETGGRGEAGACVEPRSISSSRASAREARCAARADARVPHPRRDACAARKPR